MSPPPSSARAVLIAAALTEIPGSSDVFDRGFVVYTNIAKNSFWTCATEVLKQHGAVSEAGRAARWRKAR